ncbi:MAG: translocation/assembly module TamB domain-containing protein, partial [Desulforhopalus sp.]
FIRTNTVDFVNQAGAAELAMSPSMAVIKDFCVMDRGAKLCLNGSVDLSDRLLWSVEGDAHDLDLAALNRWGVTQLPVTGSGTVNFEFQGDGSKPLKGDVVARFSEIDFDISELSDEIEKYRIKDCNFKMQFEDSILNSLLALNLASGGSLLFDVSTNQMPNDFNHIDEVKLSGSLLLDRIDMGLLSLITDHQLEATGISSGEFKLSGSLNTPQLSGTASLAEGEIAIPDFGITLQEIAVKLDADTDGVQVTGTTVSGKGMIELAGKIGFGKQGLDGHLQVTGNNFELVNLPEYTFLISPEVEVDFTGDSAHIKGLITVPEGVIYPEELRSSIKESSDVIFIDSRPEVKKNHWPIKADLDVQLGDDIAIDGYGLSGKLGGKLSVRTTPSGPFVGSGEIALTRGDFTFQNSVLEIERGRVLFTGGPLNNPGVDVRAKKQVRGGRNQIRGVTVGIEISGLVEDLQFQLFSDPYLDEGEILSYLMVGQDLRGRAQNKKTGRLNPAALSFGIQGSTHSGANYGDLFGEDKFRNLSGDEKENTSVALGTNLTKGLFVSYDVNTFNQQGQFRVRYDMSRGFFIETRSSSETAGADLLYIFER